MWQLTARVWVFSLTLHASAIRVQCSFLAKPGDTAMYMLCTHMQSSGKSGSGSWRTINDGARTSLERTKINPPSFFVCLCDFPCSLCSKTRSTSFSQKTPFLDGFSVGRAICEVKVTLCLFLPVLFFNLKKMLVFLGFHPWSRKSERRFLSILLAAPTMQVESTSKTTSSCQSPSKTPPRPHQESCPSP